MAACVWVPEDRADWLKAGDGAEGKALNPTPSAGDEPKTETSPKSRTSSTKEQKVKIQGG